MKTMIVTGVAGVLLVALPALAADKEQEAKPSYWMRKKLEYSERILTGLSSENFDEIGQSARSMSVVSLPERWVRRNVPGYREQLKAFQQANERMIHAADQEDLDAAAQGFVQLTMSCVNCHKVVRGASRAAAPSSQ